MIAENLYEETFTFKSKCSLNTLDSSYKYITSEGAHSGQRATGSLKKG